MEGQLLETLKRRKIGLTILCDDSVRVDSGFGILLEREYEDLGALVESESERAKRSYLSLTVFIPLERHRGGGW